MNSEPSEEGQQSSNPNDPNSSGPIHDNVSEMGPRCSQLNVTQSAAGAAMKGIPHTSRLEWAIEEVHESTRCTQDVGNLLHVAVQTQWVPLSLDCEEHAMLSSDTDPKTWREAMDLDDTLEWIEGLIEEMESLRAHYVFTLVPRHSIPSEFWIIKSKPHCH